MKSGGHPLKLRKGAWGSDEDTLLRKCIEKYGEGKWHLVPHRAGLNRCRKSCRLRWLNYLRPSIKRGDFDEDEVDLMIRLHKLLGNRWSLVAGRLPGRTANDVKNYWNTNVQRKLKITSYQRQKELINRKEHSATTSTATTHVVVKPFPRTLSKGTRVPCYNLNPVNHMYSPSPGENTNMSINKTPSHATQPSDHDEIEWWKNMFAEIGIHGEGETSLEGLLMASSGDLGPERGPVMKTDESLAPATEATDLLEEDGRRCWGDIWDLLNPEYN